MKRLGGINTFIIHSIEILTFLITFIVFIQCKIKRLVFYQELKLRIASEYMILTPHYKSTKPSRKRYHLCYHLIALWNPNVFFWQEANEVVKFIFMLCFEHLLYEGGLITRDSHFSFWQNIKGTNDASVWVYFIRWIKTLWNNHQR